MDENLNAFLVVIVVGGHYSAPHSCYLTKSHNILFFAINFILSMDLFSINIASQF